jgi:anti-anti-sigma factor
VTTSVDGDATVVTIAGELDAATGALFRYALSAAADARRDICIDMSGVSFIDSSGLGILITAYKRAEEAGSRLYVVNPSKAVVRLLTLTMQLDRFTRPDA